MTYQHRSYYEALLTNPNVIAMLHTIAEAEGCSDNYGCGFGGSQHPLNSPSHPYSGSDCTKVSGYDYANNLEMPRAVGRYQFCGDTWENLSPMVGGLDFSNPRDQDIAAIALIDGRGVLEQVKNGDVRGALEGTGGKTGLAYEWASLPPFRYGGQGTKTMEQAEALFASFNGKPLGASSSSSSSISSTSSSVMGSSVGGTAQRKKCPDWDRTMKQGKIITGCDMAGSLGFGNSMSIAGGPNQGVPGAASTTSLVNVPINVADLKGKLLWPLRNQSGAKTGIITSGYGWRNSGHHNGMDIADGGGNPIVAAAPGLVVYAGPETGHYGGTGFSGYGNCVLIEHNRPSGKIWTFYAHMSSLGISANTQVQAGTGLGIEGMTGTINGRVVSTGPHLHFEVRLNVIGSKSGTIDPEPLLDFNQ